MIHYGVGNKTLNGPNKHENKNKALAEIKDSKNWHY